VASPKAVKAAPAKASKTAVKAPPVKLAGKPVAKAPAKVVEKAAAKPAKAAAKPVPPAPAKKQATAKPVAKPVAPAPTKAAAKPAAKPAVKPVPKPVPKAAPAPAKVVATKPAAAAPVAKPAATIAPVSPPTAAKVALKTAPLAVPAVPPKAPRPSSRLAQVTVPSMAQSVASTAPKASFTPYKDSPVIAPVSSASIKKDPKLANNWKSTSPDKLTDAELMAMPDAEYMNDAQLAAFRHRLVLLKEGILSNAGETTEHLREDTSIVPDPADRATIEEEHALELRTRDRERKLLKKIEMSIARIDAGDYGYCDETGEPIGVGRLLARPTATLSLEAQQRRELKQKMYGD
jgi:DnaK suppressor protein